MNSSTTGQVMALRYWATVIRRWLERWQNQVAIGTHPGLHQPRNEWGQWVHKLVPSAERMRFTPPAPSDVNGLAPRPHLQPAAESASSFAGISMAGMTT